MLLTASFLLSPGLFLSPFTHRQRLWIVKRLTNRHWTRVTVLVTVLFFALTALLVLTKSSSAGEQARAGMRQNVPTGTSHILTRPIAMQERP
jgi:preprotein translocase subunit SecG